MSQISHFFSPSLSRIIPLQKNKCNKWKSRKKTPFTTFFLHFLHQGSLRITQPELSCYLIKGFFIAVKRAAYNSFYCDFDCWFWDTWQDILVRWVATDITSTLKVYRKLWKVWPISKQVRKGKSFQVMDVHGSLGPFIWPTTLNSKSHISNPPVILKPWAVNR